MFDASDPRNSVGRCGTQATSASQIRRGQRPQVHTVDQDPPRRRRHEPQQHRQHRALPGPARPDQRHPRTGGHRQVHIGQSRNAGVGNRNPLEDHRRRTPATAPGRRTRRNHRHRKSLPQRRQPLRRRMELRARRPQRQVRLRRQHQDQQRRPSIKRTGEQPEARSAPRPGPPTASRPVPAPAKTRTPPAKSSWSRRRGRTPSNGPSKPGAAARPNTFSVSSPRTTSRKCPPSFVSRSHWVRADACACRRGSRTPGSAAASP